MATSLNDLGDLYTWQKRYKEAEQLYKRALGIRKKVHGPDHPDVARTLHNLGDLYTWQERYVEAEKLYTRALDIREKMLGIDNPDTAQTLHDFAELRFEEGRYTAAEPLYKRALTIREKVLDPDDLRLGQSHGKLAELYFVQGDWARAAEFGRRSTGILVRRAQRGADDVGQALTGTKKEAEMQREVSRFLGLVKAAHRLALRGPGDKTSFASEMFRVAQWAHSSEAAHSLAQMAARGAKGNPTLAALVRERQDLAGEWKIRDKANSKMVSQAPEERDRDAEEVNLARMAAIDAQVAEIDRRLKVEFPDYGALSWPEPLSVAEVQTELKGDEALVLFLDTPELKPAPEETFIWVVTKTDVRWVRSDLGSEALGREVAVLRCGLDAAAWTGTGAEPCAKALGGGLPEKTPNPLPFDHTRAHRLYMSLFGEVEDLVRGKHLLIVPSGALTTLPFQVLITEAPQSKDLAAARWLIRDHAITVLPSAASLVALRRTGRPSAAPKPMLGFANPLLDGSQRDPKYGAWYRQQAERARAQTECAPAPGQRTAALRAIRRSPAPVPQTAGLADLAHLKVQTPLPETADEVCEVARAVGADVSEMRIGARATETEIKQLSAASDLARYRILHFATHGLLAGQLSGTREPGLILTPPKTATQEDDGYLSGGEIAGLKLDADWVILSACNTAGGAGAGEAAEALSGLARVFFCAGARALLVSHWEVDSDAAVKLVTMAVGAMAKDDGIGRAEALRHAMLAVMVEKARPAHWTPAWHPAVWAPFVVVGEGGAAARR